MVSTPTIRLKVCAGFLLFGVALVVVSLYHSDGTSVSLYHGDGTSMACPTLARAFLFSGRD